jgi:hypothetical protein
MGRNQLKRFLPSRSNRRDPYWAELSDDKLLELRLCDLNVSIEGTPLEERIEQVLGELEDKGLVHFKPHFWLSSTWFTPDGVPGVAIPFYLAHRRLARLEESQMLEVEGGTRDWCLRLLRHEVGHAVSNAYRLPRLRRWREVFGKVTLPYPQYYHPKPYSKKYVLHLDYWYAQAHPSEDFAETFAVWLTPGASWKHRYKGWPALQKLEFVDELMQGIAGKRPLVNTREQVEPLRSLRFTLRKYYESKRDKYGTLYPDFYDRDLRRLFSDKPRRGKRESAASFLRRIRPEIRKSVSEWTGQYQYTIDQVLKEMIVRARELKLHVDRPEKQARMDATIMLTVQTMNYLHAGHHRCVVL